MLAALELAVAQGLDAELEIRGPQLTDDERAHRQELETTIAASDALRTRARIEPPVPRAELPGRLATADALLSATQPRASQTLDKVVYEAAACGVPVLASNPALEEFLGGLPLELRFPARDAEALADRLLALAAAGAGAAGRGRGRAAPPSRGGPLARLVGGRGRRGRGPPEAGVAFGRGVRAIRAARARLRRARHPRAASVRAHTPPDARVRAARPRDRRARDPRRARAGSGPLRGAGHPQRRLRRHDLLEPALARRARRVAALPASDHLAGLLARRPLRAARAARRARPRRLVDGARRRDHARVRLRHRLRLHDLGPRPDRLRHVRAPDRGVPSRVRLLHGRAAAAASGAHPGAARR